MNVNIKNYSMRETGLKTYGITGEPSSATLRFQSRKASVRSPGGAIGRLTIPSLTELIQDHLTQTISAQLKSPYALAQEEEQARLMTPSTRARTLKIFKQKIMTEKKEGYDLYMGKKSGGDTIKMGDSENTVRYLVSKKKREYETKKKPSMKGTMYVNDLWATDFEKDIIKQTKIDRELTRPYKFHHKPVEKSPVSPLERRKEMMKPVTIPSRDSSLGDIVSADLPKKGREKAFLLGEDRRYFTERSEKASSAGLRRKPMFTEESAPDIMFPKKFSQPTMPLLKMDEIVSYNGPSGRKFSGSIDGCQSARNLYTKKLHAINTDRNMYTESGDMSPTTGSLTSRDKRNTEQRVSDLKMFLGAASQQFDLLLGDCETELREKPDFIMKINDLKELFMSPKFDKKKKQEVMDRQKTMSDCKWMLNKKAAKNSPRTPKRQGAPVRGFGGKTHELY